MTKFDIGQILQLVGNAGVIIGILLLVYELNQNRSMMMAQTRNELSQGIVDVLISVSDDEESADIWIRGTRGDELAGHDLERYRLMAAAERRYQENVHYQYRQGLYDEREFQSQRDTWELLFRAKGRVDAFCVSRSGYSPEYVQEIEALLTIHRCE